MSESFREQVERVIQMSRDDGETWDLSVNDQAALKAVLQRMAVLDALCADMLAALRHTHAEFCSARCPSTFKSLDEPRHCPDCDTIRAVIGRAEGR